MEQAKMVEADRAKRGIAEGWVPTARRGDWQVRIVAVDAVSGADVVVDPELSKMFGYHQFETEQKATAAAEDISKDFANAGDGIYDMPVLEGNTWETKKIKLVGRWAAVQKERLDPGQGNIHEFSRLITQFGIQLRPEKREQITKMMSSQSSRLRRGLRREGVEGANVDMVRSVSEFLEEAASIVARNTHMHKIDAALDKTNPQFDELWYGSETRYAELDQNWKAAEADPTLPLEAKQSAKREFYEYHYIYKTMKSKTQGSKYIDRAVHLVTFINSQRDIAYNEFATGEISGRLRNLTVVSQLGGSFATGLLNIISVGTNTLPALASYNQKTNFGGGFGFGKSAMALSVAGNQVGRFTRNTVEYYQSLKDNPAMRKSVGLSEVEVNFMYDFINSGRGDSASSNSLMATTRGRATSGASQKFIETFMYPFTASEQSSRRISGLAAFRLQYEHSKAAGMSDVDAYNKASAFSIRLMDDAIGQYANFGMPAAFRGGAMQFLFMYKVFPVTTFNVLKNMDYKGKIAMVGALIILGGIKGIPFSEDLMDILDTLAQKLLGMKVGSVEVEFYKMADSIMPGLGAILAHGLIDGATPATVSTRTQTGNIIPGTSGFLPYADKYREVQEVLGPMASSMQQYVATANNIGKYILEAAGLKADTTSLNQILRESPITMLRAVADTYAYQENGSIVNRRGYLVSDDLHFGTYMARLLGFYPSAASRQNEVISMSMRVANYSKEVSINFRTAWLKARAVNDLSAMRHVEQQVRDWNEGAEGTGLEVTNFLKNAARAYKQMMLPATTRSLKAMPKSVRPTAETMIKIFE